MANMWFQCAALLLTWVFAYFCIWRGVKSVGTAVKFTVILPWVLLGVLTVFNATLDGSGNGVRAYIGEWNLDVLANGAAWSDAAGQIFFTLGTTLGACWEHICVSLRLTGLLFESANDLASDTDNVDIHVNGIGCLL
jgi:SNF family Na+-dependent transporter